MIATRLRLPMAALLCLPGCAVGPDYHRPAPLPVPASFIAAHDTAQRFAPSMDVPGQWWALYRCQPLDALIARSLAANPTLTAAQANLRQARENLYAQEGSFFPDLTATFEPTRNKTATRSVSPASGYALNGSAYYNLITAELAVSYTPDIWGANRRLVESLVATTEQQRFQLEATYLSLTSSLVVAAITEASLRAQILATREIIAAETELLVVLRKQLAVGQIAEVDELAQVAALAQAQATLPPLQHQLGVQRDLMATLSGVTSDRLVPETFDFTSLQLPPSVPESLPAAIVDHRPDVRQAEAALHAASAQVGVAVANRLPALTLSANGGTASNFFRDLFARGNGFWTIAATLTQPVFDGGTLLHKARAARANLEQMEAQYQATVLTAYQNVADSLKALQTDADTQTASATAEKAAFGTLQIVRLQVRLGQAPYLNILNAEQVALQARLSFIEAAAARYADTASLFQALGGGWWNRHDVVVRDLHGNDVAAILGLH